MGSSERGRGRSGDDGAHHVGRHWVGAALLDLVALVGTVALLVAWSWTRCRPAAWLLLPYLAWLLYAASLNAAILVLNPSA